MFTAWLRCYLMCNVLYFVTGGMWAYYVYLCWGDKLFADGNMPAAVDMWEQIKVNIALLTQQHRPLVLGCKHASTRKC